MKAKRIVQKLAKDACKAVVFLLILGTVLGAISRVLKFKYDDGILPLNYFYELPENSCDVIFCGTSHAFESFNPAIVWREEGIPSFTLAGSSQPTWSTYYYMKEALKYQNPKVFVMDIDSTYFWQDHNDYSRIVKNTIGLRPSLDRLAAAKVNATEDVFIDVLLGFPTYHTRYGELSKRDFLPDLGNPDYYEEWKGFCENPNQVSFTPPRVSNETEIVPMTDKTYEYFIKIIELCRENDVELLLVCSPYFQNTLEQKTYNHTAQVAEQYGVPLINFNIEQDRYDLNYATDMGDDQHMNTLGSTKYSAYIAGYLMDNYDLADRRGDDYYSSWDKTLEVWESTHK